MSLQSPKLKVDNVQEVQKQTSSNFATILEVVCVIGQVLFFLLKLFYYWGELIYYKLNPLPVPTDLRGEIVLITGTGHGIGKELALTYSAKGATVVGWDLDKKTNDETIKEIAEIGGRPKAYSFKCDITNREEVLRVANEVRSTVGEVTILINNAGIMPCHLFEDHSNQEIEKIIQVNLTSHFWLLEAFLPTMKQNNYGYIVSLSSMAGMVGFANLIPYCASKFAVRGYMEALHEELRFLNPNNKIKVTSIYPYMVDTGLCKRPKIKYEHLMPLLSPKQVAQEILEAQMKGLVEVTIPSYMSGLLRFARLIPYNASLVLKDTFQACVESDL